MTERIARLGISIAYQDAAAAKGELRQLAGQARATETATERLTRETKQYGRAQSGANASVRSASGLMRAAQTAAAGLIAALGVRQVIQYADAWQSATNRLRIVIDTTEELKNAQTALFDISQRTFTQFGATADLYSRLARANDTLNKSQEELLRLSETVGKAVAVSGASAQAAQASLIQFGQALSGDFKAAAQELNSITEQTPALAQAIAQGLGVTRGELKKIAAEGELSSERVIAAIEKMAPTINEQFERINPTFGQLFQRLQNEITKFVGGLGNLFQPFKNALQGLVDNFGVVTRAIQGATAALLVFVAIQLPSFAAQVAASLATWFNATVRVARATNELNAAVKAGNAILLGSAAAQKAQAAFQVEQTAASVRFAEAQSAQAATRLADARATQAQLKSTLALITAQRAEAASRLELARGITAATGVRTAQAAAEANLARTMAAGIATRKALAATEAEIATAQAVSASATAQLAAAQTAQAAAATRAAASTGFLSRALVQLRGVVTGLWAIIVANPLGVLVTAIVAATAALVIFRDKIARSLSVAKDWGEFWRAISGVIGDTFKRAITGASDLIRDAGDALVESNPQWALWADQIERATAGLGGLIQKLNEAAIASPAFIRLLEATPGAQGLALQLDLQRQARGLDAATLPGAVGAGVTDAINTRIEQTRRREQENVRRRAVAEANRSLGAASFSSDIPGVSGQFLDDFGVPDISRAPIQIDPFKKPDLKPFERQQTAETDVELFKLNSLADAFAKGDRAARIFAEALSLADDKAAQVSETTLKLAGDIVTAQDRLQFNKVSASIRTQIEELGALTKAYGESVEAGRVQEEAFKLFGDGALATSEAGLAKAREFLKAQDEAASVKLTAELERQQEQLAALAGEYEKGDRAARIYSEALKIAGQTSGEVTAQTLELAEAIVKAQETQRTLEATASIKRQADSIARLKEGLKGSFRDFQIAAKQAELIANGWDEAAASSIEAAKRAVEYERVLERINEQAERLAAFDFDPFEEFGSNIADVATDFFQQFREEGFKAFDELGKNFTDTFKRLGRDIFSKAVLEPILRPIIDVFGGIGIGDQNGRKDITLRETSRDITSEIGRSTDRIVAAVRSGPSPVAGSVTSGPVATGGPRNLITGEGFEEQSTGIFDGLRQKFDRIAEGYQETFRRIGKTLEGISEEFGKAVQSVSKQLGSLAAGATAGFAGFGVGTGLADFFNGDKGETGSKVGGAVGGGIGFAVGGPVGAFVGAAAGGFFGDLIGGAGSQKEELLLGLALGGPIGLGLAALFGKKSNQVGQVVFDPETGDIRGTGQKDNSSASNQNLEIAKEISNQIGNAVSSIVESIGATILNKASTPFRDDLINVAAGSRDGIRIGYQGARGEIAQAQRFENTEEGAQRAIEAGIRLALSNLSGSSPLARFVRDAAKAGKPLEDLGNALTDIKAALDLNAEPLSAFERTLNAMRETFSKAETAAKGFEATLKEIAKAEEGALKRLAQEFDKDLASRLRGIESPVGQQFFELLDAQQQRFSDAQALNDEIIRATKAAGGNVGAARSDARQRLNQASELATAEFVKLIEQVASTPGALAQAAEAFAEFKADIAKSGIDTSALEGALASATEAVRDAFNKQVQDDILAFRSPTFAAFQNLLEQQKELESFANEVGGNLIAVQARNAEERERFFKSLTDEQKNELGDFLGLIEDVSGRIGVVLSSLEDHISRYVDSAEEQVAATMRAAEAFQGYAQSIDDSLFNINTQFGAGNPEQRLQSLQEEFFRLASDAKGGDETAFEKLGPLGEQIVGQARDLFAGTARFASIRDTVTGALEGLRDFASERATALFSEAEQFQEELEALKDIRNLLADPEGTDLLRSILESGRLQNDISVSLVSELIALREAQEQNEAVTLAQLQAATFSQSSTGGTQSAPAANDNSQAILAAQQQAAKAYTELSRETAKQNSILLDLNASFKELTKEVNRDRTQRAINE